MSIARLFTQTASVQTRTGTGTSGDKFAAAVDVLCFVNDGHERKAEAAGVEIVSQTTLYAPLASIDTFAVGSKVTVNGRTAHVVSVFRRDSAGPTSAHHAQVNLV